jgi:uncharacterized membrane protein YkvA (DUF1232 family)
MCNLLNSNIDREDRGNIAKALGYFVAPTDVIFEEVYGPMGYIDDLYLCCYVLEDIKNKYGMELLEKHWDSDRDLDKTLNDCYTKSTDFINDDSLREYILKYVGLV